MQEAGVDSIPFLGFWPRGHTWAWCLTHDVDTGIGYRHIEALAAVEEARQLHSSWYFVPERYPVDRARLEELRQRGHEIGVHGLSHTGKLFSSRAEFAARLPRVNDHVRAWGAVGFRSPATYRNPFWLPEIDADYDSSYMDNATLEPQHGGICSAFPFMLSDRMVELPITLPMDHTLINILRQDVLQSCLAKLDWVRAQNGLALALFHPDYNTTPARRAPIARCSIAWRRMPRAGTRCRGRSPIAQRRRRSRVVLENGAPRIEGPAAADGDVWSAHRDGERLRIEIPLVPV
jgi:peptidoglycan/xylan/chitin deacetylase (PgdA/CDA1 family)